MRCWPGVLMVLLTGIASARGQESPSDSIAAENTPKTRIIATTPDPALRLGTQQPLYVHLKYAWPAPLRFQARPYLRGEELQTFRMNTAPAYSAGQGDAIVWLSGEPGARIDEIRIRLFDLRWKELTAVTVKVNAEWHAGVPEAPTAPWARELMDAQKNLPQLVHENEGTSWLGNIITALGVLLVPVAFASVPAYPALQIFALVKLRGTLRLVAGFPLVFMIPVYGVCLFALLQNSNLWPLWAIFASPVAFIITLVPLLIGLRRQKHSG